MNGKMTSCNVTLIAAAILLLLKSQATPMESNVFMLHSGVNPKKTPIATPSAIECGVSSMEIRRSWCARHQFLKRVNQPKRAREAESLGLTLCKKLSLPRWRFQYLPEGGA